MDAWWKIKYEYEKLGLSKITFAKTKEIPRTFMTIFSTKERFENSLHLQHWVKQKKKWNSNYKDAEDGNEDLNCLPIHDLKMYQFWMFF